jgi:membrane-bound lytic murein transglycosylase F
MQTDPWETPDEPRPRPHPAESPDHAINPLLDDTDPGPPPADEPQIPPPLRNWQVIEIEGEATVGAIVPDPVEEPAPPPLAAATAAPTHPIPDHVDEVLLALAATRRVQVMPGSEAALAVELINNGRLPALFEVAIEGWLDAAWCPDLPLRVPLQPGARQTVEVRILPPARASSRTGDHPFALVIHSPDYPERSTRLGVTAQVEPFIAFTLGAPHPRRLHTSWFTRTDTLRVPLTNQSNQPVAFALHAADRRQLCTFRFLSGRPLQAGLGAVQVTVGSGQTAQIPLEVEPGLPPLVRIGAPVTPFRITAWPADDAEQRRSVDGAVVTAPLIGPWTLAGVGLLVVLGIVGSGLAGLLLILALSNLGPAPAPPPPTAPPVVQTQPAEPVIALIMKMNEQAAPSPARPPVQGSAGLDSTGGTTGTSEAGSRPGYASIPQVRAEDVTTPGAALPASQTTPRVGPDGIPMVDPGQVTAPGQPVPTGVGGGVPAAELPVARAQTPNPRAAGLTYGQMFREMGTRYDLDWRLLAAQAYVESGFDSVALSNQGAMGLMQIHPITWREWAPQVGVSDPFDSYSNVLVAAAYLDHLRTLLSGRGQSRVEWMLVAYNWGPDNVLDYLAEGGTWETLDEDLRQYALEVLRIAATLPPN